LQAVDDGEDAGQDQGRRDGVLLELTSVKATLNFMTTRGGVMRPAGEARRRQELLLETEGGGRFTKTWEICVS
jgi:hypothetical protein